MTRISFFSGYRKALALLFGGAGLALAVPAGVSALGGEAVHAASYSALPAFVQFTPAGIDPALVRKAEAIAKAKGLSFTPAGAADRQSKPMTVAVRVDADIARNVNVRRSVASVSTASGRLAIPVVVTPTRYDLGTARGYQSFATATATPFDKLGTGTRKVDLEDVPMADLSAYGVEPKAAAGKPSRFSSRVVVEADTGVPGLARNSIESLGDQSVDVSGSYRVLRNLNVTAGVRLSQDRDRLAPLTDAEQDAKAVYVGTQFKF